MYFGIVELESPCSESLAWSSNTNWKILDEASVKEWIRSLTDPKRKAFQSITKFDGKKWVLYDLSRHGKTFRFYLLLIFTEAAQVAAQLAASANPVALASALTVDPMVAASAAAAAMQAKVGTRPQISFFKGHPILRAKVLKGTKANTWLKIPQTISRFEGTKAKPQKGTAMASVAWNLRPGRYNHNFLSLYYDITSSLLHQLIQ